MSGNAIRPDLRVAEVLVGYPFATRVFEVLAIDFCCGTTKAISAAAEAAGIEFGELTDLLTDDGGDLSASRVPEGFADWPLTHQVEHLAKQHHRFTRKQLLRLDRDVRRVWSGHRKFSGIARLRVLIAELIDDLIPHMAREERYLFPYMRSLEGNSRPGDRVSVPLHGNLEYPLASITHDHTEDSDRLMELRELTSGFAPQGDACGAIRTLYAGLAELERDLQEHIRIENQVVFPRALELERAARDRAKT